FMRNHFYLLSLLVALMSLTSCSTPIFSLSTLEPETNQPLDLPHLAFEIDQASFERVYQRGFIAQIDEDEPNTTVFSTSVNPQIPDTYTLSERSVHQWISRPSGPQYGYARVHINGVSKGNSAAGLTIGSALLLFIPNLAGVPVARPQAEVSIELEILDGHGQTLGRYRGNGSKRKTVGFYYGKREGNIRNLHAMALKEAWEDIYLQVRKDADQLNYGLLRSGPIMQE
ncbi:MAG: hypothetical protein AAFV07_11945, partial [Bacteroidota bacterium]